MQYRKKVYNKRGDKKYFSKTADHSNSKNYRSSVMRGGIRL